MAIRKIITVCADDFAFSPNISRGVLTLIELKRLNAVSCMTNSVDWMDHSQWLKPHAQTIQIGLHLNLTDGEPLSKKWTTFPTHVELIKKCYMRSLSINDVYDEFSHQLMQFKSALGRLPDFVDGHRHIHQLPMIRDALLHVYNDFFPMKNAYIRIPGNDFKTTFAVNTFSFKKMMIYLTGCEALKKLLEKNSIPHNTSFEGIYDFKNSSKYQHYFREFLRDIKNNGLIMCHPSLTDEKSGDEIYRSRQDELNYLMSDAFLNDCESFGVEFRSVTGPATQI